MISQLFRAQRKPGQIPVTDAHVSSTKNDASGILIRRLSKKRPLPAARKENESCSNNDNDSVNGSQNSSESKETNGANDDNGADTNKSGGEKKDAGDESATGGNPKHNDNSKEHQNSHDISKYRPRPGDSCVIRYDCYTLSPLLLESDRHGNPQLAKDGPPRKRTWVEGNFEKRYRHPDIFNEGTATSNSTIPNYEKEESLRLPALQFEVGNGIVLRGLEVAVQRMVEGEVVECTIPHLYAYGENGLYPRIPPKTDLLFVIKLLQVLPTKSNQKAWEKEVNCDNNHESTAQQQQRDNNGNMETFVMMCNGFVEGALVVTIGITIPLFLLLRSDLHLDDVFQDMGTFLL